MSYHVQQNTQQRSIGIFIVIAFHVLLIWALVSGLGKAIHTVINPPPIQLSQVEQQVKPPLPIDPIEPVIAKPTKIVVTHDNLANLIFDDAQPPVVIGSGKAEPIATPNISKPLLLKATKPEYPSGAARLGEEGATALKLLINTDGRVADVQLVTSSGSSRLDEAAIKHAKRNWAFSPCTEGGKAVSCWYQTKLVWRLENAGR
jgi:protein TonB